VAFAALALVAAALVPPVHAHASAAPSNIQPPGLVVEPGLGSRLTISPGSWSGSPTSFSYQYLRCPAGGGAADGSDCTPTSVPSPTPDVHLIIRTDVAHSFRARVTATNATGSTNAVSAASGAARDTEVNVSGCPPVQQAGATVEELEPPARLLIYRYTSNPAVITNSTQRITLRVNVVACDNQTVRGALVFATPTPFQMFSESESATDATGWATLTLTRKRFFPATPRQQRFVVFLRARKPGEDLLGGISTRRLVSFTVRLH
jgi:hypothetical protein